MRNNRPGAGRPREIQNPIRIGLSIDGAMNKRLNKASEEREMSKSAILRRALGSWLDRNVL